MAAAQSYMTGALGEDYPEDDPRVIAAQKLVVADLYDNRDLPDKTTSATRRVLDSMLTQVRMEMRIAAEAGDGE